MVGIPYVLYAFLPGGQEEHMRLLMGFSVDT